MNHVTGLDAVHKPSQPEWYTPGHIVDAVIETMGAIDLDPCSNPGIPAVNASNHFTKAENGLMQPWLGRVYMNPPWTKDKKVWADKLQQEIAAGNTTEAIVLLPISCVGAKWWNAIFLTWSMCVLRGHLHFIPEYGVAGPCPFITTLLYYGPNIARFGEVFGKLGSIWHV